MNWRRFRVFKLVQIVEDEGRFAVTTKKEIEDSNHCSWIYLWQKNVLYNTPDRPDTDRCDEISKCSGLVIQKEYSQS